MSETKLPQDAKSHDLKVWPEFWRDLASGAKTFEVRKNDRDYQVGDMLVLRAWDPMLGQYLGDEIRRVVTYVYQDNKFDIVAEDSCVLGLGRIQQPEDAPPPGWVVINKPGLWRFDGVTATHIPESVSDDDSDPSAVMCGSCEKWFQAKCPDCEQTIQAKGEPAICDYCAGEECGNQDMRVYNYGATCKGKGTFDK